MWLQTAYEVDGVVQPRNSLVSLRKDPSSQQVQVNGNLAVEFLQGRQLEGWRREANGRLVAVLHSTSAEVCVCMLCECVCVLVGCVSVCVCVFMHLCVYAFVCVCMHGNGHARNHHTDLDLTGKRFQVFLCALCTVML